MRFEWDEDKAAENLRRHGLDFARALEAFRPGALRIRDRRQDYGEERRLLLRLVDRVAIVVAYTVRDGRYRIISARRANRRKRRALDPSDG